MNITGYCNKRWSFSSKASHESKQRAVVEIENFRIPNTFLMDWIEKLFGI